MKKNPKNILVVDDEETLLDTMKDLLENKGYAVLAANNGVTGLKILAERDVSGVVLDLNMPRMDGYMFLEHLKGRWATDGIGRGFPRVLVLTAVDKNTDLGLARNLGAVSFMNKPFKSTEFLAAIERLVNG